ncbi:MAG: insulinase family protein [Acidobacteria bacterium]|nr:insulinase family protein [Acidobacteriota bacterium]
METIRKGKIFSLILLLVLFVGVVKAQDVDLKKLDQAIPMDYRVKQGVLPNGIKYYIQKNAKPEKRVELRLAVNAGSLQEDDDQQGLAHFVEHMCFNGTKNFKKNEIVSYLQSVGVQFGAHLNAYTSFDETVYILTLPSDKQDIMNKGFQILEDWAHNVTFEDSEIDKERGVVIEEWRTGLGAGQRIRDKTFPVVFKNSRYAERLPIGKREILENFKYETLKRFYKDWYRPDLMAVIVVGDIDEVEMEAKIKEHFSKIAPKESPRPRESAEIPNHKEMLTVTATDKESNFAQAQVIFKHPAEKTLTFADNRKSILYDLFRGMINRRLAEIAQQADPPYNGAFAGFGGFLRTKSAYTLSTSASEKKIELALKTLLTENKRVLDHGFTQGELENYKKELLSFYENDYNERDKVPSAQHAARYVRSFLSTEPSPSIEWEFEFLKKALPTINVSEINQLIKRWVTDENIVISVTGPEKDELKAIGENNIKSLLKEVAALKPEAYVFKEISAPLMATLPKAGKIVKETSVDILGAKELILSNGIKVVIKPTDFNNDQIQMNVFSFGGSSLQNAEDDPSSDYATAIVNQAGIGNFSQTDLEKVLSGKNATVFPFIGRYSEGLRGNSTPKDFETLLQLTNMFFTQPRKDEKAYQSFLTRTKAFAANFFANPQLYYGNELQKVLTQEHPRANIFNPEKLDKVSLDKAFQIYKERFADADDFQFFFVGNIDIEKAKPLLELYLGSLPVKEGNETFKDLGIRPPTGIVEKEVKKGKDPKSQVTIVFTNPVDNRKDQYLIRSLAEGLSIKLIENLREDKGGVYSTRANSSIGRYPYESYQVTIGFSCAPENAQKLINAAYEEIKKIQENGFTPEDLVKIKEGQKRSIERNQKENGYWLGVLQNVYVDKIDANELTEANLRKLADDLSSEGLKATAQKYLKLDNRIVVTMNPE